MPGRFPLNALRMAIAVAPWWLMRGRLALLIGASQAELAKRLLPGRAFEAAAKSSLGV